MFFHSKKQATWVYFLKKNYLCHVMFIICKTIFFNREKLNKCFSYLKFLVSSFDISRLNCCNYLLMNLPTNVIDFQQLLSQDARFILRKSTLKRIPSGLVKLHWLPVHSRLQYNTSILCYKMPQFYFHLSV